MTEDEMKSLAQEFAEAHMENFEFITLAEDPYMGQTPHEDLEELHDLITSAQVTLSWPEEEVRKPLVGGELFSTLRGMHPSEDQLRAIEDVEREQLTPGIHADMVAQAGKVLPFEFTGVVTDGSGRVWHEFVVEENPEELTLYACFGDYGYVHVEQERPE